MSVIVNIPGSNFRTFADNAGSWAVLDIVAEPIGNETAGDAYLISPVGLGEFETKGNYITILTANDGWYFIAPLVGKIVFDASNGVSYRWNGSAWVVWSGGGSSGGGLGDRTVSATSSAPEKDITADDAGGIVVVDGANGAFNVVFDPSLLPGMKVKIKRKDSVDNANAIPVKNGIGTTITTLTANGDTAELWSHSGGTEVEVYSTGNAP